MTSVPQIGAPRAALSTGGTFDRLDLLAQKLRRRASIWGPISPAAVVLGLFFVVPLGFFFVYSFWRLKNFQILPEWNVSNYTNAVTDPVNRTVMLQTIEIAAITAAITTTLACAFASVLRFQLRRYQDRILFLVMIAMFSGYIVRIFAWRTILGTQGLVNSALMNLHLISHPLSYLLYTRFAVILVLTNFLLPLAILPCHAAMQNVADEHIQASRDLGCGAWRTYRRVALPIAWPGVSLSLAITFIVVSGDYLTPEVVGSPNGTMIGQNIANIFLTEFNWPSGAALAFVSLAAVLVSVTSLHVIGRKVVR